MWIIFYFVTVLITLAIIISISVIFTKEDDTNIATTTATITKCIVFIDLLE